MKKASLNKNDKKLLRQTSRDKVQDTLNGLKKFMENGQFLSATNRYRHKTEKYLAKDMKQSPPKINELHLRQYISVSSILHCADGWGYLGRSLYCHSYADNFVSRHLAYYSELRAAMAIMAAEGFGIFDRRNFVVDKKGNCHQVKGSTHQMSWQSLEHWAGTTKSTEILAQIIIPQGIKLQDWLTAFGDGKNWWPVGRYFLNSWGLDLKNFSKDRDARNQASYRPTRLNFVKQPNVLDVSNFLCDLWEVCEPTQDSAFAQLDLQLLRYTLQKIYKAETGVRTISGNSDFVNKINDMFDKLSLRGPATQQLKVFLTKEEFLPVIEFAFQKPDYSDPNLHVKIISRAFMLSRVATGICANLLRESDLKMGDIKFWWERVLTEHGFLETIPSSVDFLEMWEDVKEAISEIKAWEGKYKRNEHNFKNLHRDCSNALLALSGCERIGIWGLNT